MGVRLSKCLELRLSVKLPGFNNYQKVWDILVSGLSRCRHRSDTRPCAVHICCRTADRRFRTPCVWPDRISGCICNGPRRPERRIPLLYHSSVSDMDLKTDLIFFFNLIIIIVYNFSRRNCIPLHHYIHFDQDIGFYLS